MEANPLAKILIEGGHPLSGTVKISGAKNAALPIMAAALLTSEECTFENIPYIDDIKIMAEVLRHLGCKVEFTSANILKIHANNISSFQAPPELVRRLRGSFLVMGPLLGRFGKAQSAPPGGCAIGKRPVSVDVKGFGTMGAEITQPDGIYLARAQNGLVGKKMVLDYPSHTGTENLLMAAALASGETIIENASVEPEVVDLANCLRAMGAHVEGAGTGIITVRGVKRLKGVTYKIIPDRIEGGTYLMAGAITGGEVTIAEVNPQHMDPVTDKLQEAGAEITETEGSLTIKITERLKAVNVRTFPYPGFPTDLQAPFAALMTQAEGASLIHETMYEDRLLYAGELQKMGGRIEVNGRTATIFGPTRLHGAVVQALDIRSGAALILAGLTAKGKTEISNIYQIDRGYENIEGKLASLGARIWREED